MHQVVVRREMDADDIAAVQELLDLAELADGHSPLGEHQWLDLVQGGRAGFAGLIALEPGHDHPVGYAQVSRGPDGGLQGRPGATSWALEYVIDPHHRVPGNSIGTDLVTAALNIVADEGGGHVHVWVNKPRPEHDHIAAVTGLRRGRDLYQMRRALPPTEPFHLETRPFRPGVDDQAWLTVNDRAFQWHPEQGGWDEATFTARQAEPWFDPQGFLLHEEIEAGQTRLAGFCWTRVHADHDPPLGEIYVVAVDPDFQGRGLGRALVLAGLGHLSSVGLAVGMLYVDAANRPAVKLYIDLGFDIDHIDRAYVGDIPAATPPPVDGASRERDPGS